uniref:Uncharacterized protein n=1 Tax=Rhizophagus irregularis (strain DAOM 181602 / DAOM 197198 / MUCL 43194) TaxID=747089 RepID=U9TVF3_RHIID
MDLWNLQLSDFHTIIQRDLLREEPVVFLFHPNSKNVLHKLEFETERNQEHGMQKVLHF